MLKQQTPQGLHEWHKERNRGAVKERERNGGAVKERERF